MRITFLMAGGLTMSGGDRVVSIYAERLRARGHTVTVVAQSPRPPSFRDQLRSIVKGKGWIRPWVPGPSHFDGLPTTIVRTPGGRPVLDGDVPDGDVVLATWFTTADWVRNLSSSKGAKAFFLQHYEVFEYTSKEQVDAAWRMPLHKITISQWLVDLARDQFGDRDVSLVFNSVDTRQFQAPPRGRQAQPTVGMIYNHAGWKGIDVCSKAIAEARASLPGLQVVAFGSHPPKPGKPQLPPDTRFVHAPAQDKIKDVYASCDLWLCGSRGEGFHLPPLEAMACRCPVVSTRVGGPSDVIQDGVNGYLVPVEDHSGLADRLLRVLRQPEPEWKRMSDAALATATRYSWDDATILFEKALERAVAKRPN